MTMNGPDLKKMSVNELLQGHAAIIAELRSRGILRSKNNPVGDYCEWLVADRLGLTLVNNSTSGYDAVDSGGIRYQIKGRRVTPDNRSRQLSAIRNLDDNDFDYLIGVILNERFDVVHAAQIPHAMIGRYAKFRAHTNAHILHLQGKLLLDSQVKDVTAVLAAAPPIAAIRPQRFALSVGGFMGPSYAVRLENGRVTYERFRPGYELAKKTVIDPSDQEWTDFSAEMDAMKAWGWKATYIEPGVADGTNWSLDIALGGKSLNAKGSNAFPRTFKRFCSAVSGLIGNRRFE